MERERERKKRKPRCEAAYLERAKREEKMRRKGLEFDLRNMLNKQKGGSHEDDEIMCKMNKLLALLLLGLIFYTLTMYTLSPVDA